MSNPDKQDVIKVNRVKVIEGLTLTKPPKMSHAEAAAEHQRLAVYEDSKAQFIRQYDVFPWDGAYALNLALIEQFGRSEQKGTPNWFGETPPAQISISTGYNKIEQVPWGAFRLSGVDDGVLNSGVNMKDGRICFQIVATVKRKYELVINDLFDRVQRKLNEHSIYRGQAISLRLLDDNGEAMEMPWPNFLDINQINEHQLVLPTDVALDVSINLFTPVERRRDLRAKDFSRRVLLCGKYGVGKTLICQILSKKCNREGITYIYAPRTSELKQVLNFALNYLPAVVVFEDVDRVFEGSRDARMDELLNQIDGVETKGKELLIVMTTNKVESMNQASLRPGRSDSVIEVSSPDADAVSRLIRMYAGPSLPSTADLASIAESLSGQIPAVVEEVVKKARFNALMLAPSGTPTDQATITTESLEIAARSMKRQIELLNREPVKDPHPFEVLGSTVMNYLARGLGMDPKDRYLLGSHTGAAKIVREAALELHKPDGQGLHPPAKALTAKPE